MIRKETFNFLKALRDNNNREWFNERKATFKEHEAEVKSFYAEIQNKLQETDNIADNKVYRIYRDVRFSKDKTPFKSRFAGDFRRATKALRGSYYLNIEPGNSIVGGGFYGPNPEDLKRIRAEIDQDDSELRTILNNNKFKAIFDELQGAEVKSAPRGFKPDHPAIDLLRKKQFILFKRFTNQEVMQEDFKEKVMEVYLTIRPFFDYMSSVLTTNLNGESILEEREMV